MQKRFPFLFPAALFSILSVACLQSGCATRGAPSGGPPDRTPPVVIWSNPAADSVQIPLTTDRIEIRFSERMEEGSLYNSIFISPPLEYELKWESAELLQLLLKDSLQRSQTYVITVGTAAQDMRQNRLKNSYPFAFSTGKFIDQGSISGTVYEQERDERPNIFAYRLTDSSEFQPAINKPSYVSQVGENGGYQLSYLKQGTYRCLAVNDINNNLLVDSDLERVGMTYRDVQLDSAVTRVRGVHFRLTRIDTLPPSIISVRSVSKTYHQIRLTEAVRLDSDSLFTVTDSIKGDTVKVLGYMTNDEFDNVIDLYSMPLDSGSTYLLHSLTLSDSSANQLVNPDPLAFRAAFREDTTRFSLINHLPGDSAKAVMPGAAIVIELSKPAEPASVREAHILKTAASDTIPGQWVIRSLVRYAFYADPFLRPDSAYISELDLSGIRDLWGTGITDSVSRHHFNIVSARELGEISGKAIRGESLEGPVVLTLRSLARRSDNRDLTLNRDQQQFRFERLPEGSYQLDGFIDADSSGSYSFGDLYPFRMAEPFTVSEDTVRVRKRWEKQGVNIIIPKTE